MLLKIVKHLVLKPFVYSCFMSLKFKKYQGTGNDFILIDNISGEWNTMSIDVIQLLCDRKFGIGADGLIKLNKAVNFDFEVDYYNSDGSKSFCGNGARCAVAFAKEIGLIIDEKTTFLAIDGEHEAFFQGGLVSLKMNDVQHVELHNQDFILNTGSPHYIHYVSQIEGFDIYNYGKEIRYSNLFQKDGINVNAVQELNNNTLKMKTYERGVEAETLSCGTGVTAAALVSAYKRNTLGSFLFKVFTPGGELKVNFERTELGFSNIWLTGPATFVFEGSVYVAI